MKSSQLFHFFTGGQFLLPQAENGKKEFSPPGCERGLSVPGAFKLDRLQPVEPILFCKFSNFCTFILEKANSYYPIERKAENGKMEISQPAVKTGHWVPGVFKLDHLQPVRPILFSKFSTFLTFILERPILITPERGMLKRGKWNSPNLSQRGDLGAWGIQTGPFAPC